MNEKIQKFQRDLLNGVAVLQNQRQVPRRLVLGQNDYAVFDHIKGLYHYSRAIIVDGCERRWGMQIDRVPDQDHLEVLP